MDSKSEIDKKLYNYYNNEFDKNYDVNTKLNKDIMTKNRMIFINTDGSDDKDLMIDALFYIMYSLFFILVIYIGYRMRFYSINTMVYMISFIICLYLYLFISKYYFNQFKRGARRAEAAAITVGRNIVGIFFPKYKSGKCPPGCHIKGHMHLIPNDDDFEQSGNRPPLRLNDPTNVWKNGQNYKELQGGHNWYGANEDAKEYHCKLREGNTDDSNINEFKSHIPCKYYIDYEEKD